MKIKYFVKKQIFQEELLEQLQCVRDFKGIVPIRKMEKQGNHLLIYMDYIEHVPFENCSEKEVIQIGIQLCDILHQFHSHNPRMIYRDMKPKNLLQDKKGNIFLIDFDTIWVANRNRDLDRKPIGTKGYAPFEQYIEGMQLEPSTDIYAIGITLMELLTNERPYNDIEQWIAKWSDTISEELLHIIKKCTAWHMQSRYQTCIELKNTLKNTLQRKY